MKRPSGGSERLLSCAIELFEKLLESLVGRLDVFQVGLLTSSLLNELEKVFGVESCAHHFVADVVQSFFHSASLWDLVTMSGNGSGNGSGNRCGNRLAYGI